jgi:A/G-specific adenine glycosylase
MSSIPNMSIAVKIIKWFDKQGRKDLPWQQNPSLYRVWISEIMLQQTQVSTVIPYYERFMKKFPDLSILAKAPLDAVLNEWTGLGYYARARNLHKTACIIQAKYQGQFPRDFETLLQLPGIGRSTAGAILALSTGQHYPILDGNVKRVLCRLFAVAGWPSQAKVAAKLWDYSEQITPSKRVDHYTQAIMDLGAMVCTRSKPNCNICPLSKDCLAKINGKVNEYPNPRPKQVKPSQAIHLIILLDPQKKTVLLEKRPAKGIWGGLWSFPECKVKQPLTKISRCWDANLNISVQSQIPMPAFRHTFTHFHLDIHPILCKIKLVKNSKSRTSKLPSNTKKSADKKLPQKGQETVNNFFWHPLNKPLQKGVAAPIKRLLEEMSGS